MVLLAGTFGCSGSLVVPHRHASSQEAHVLRIAVERGLKDASTDGSTAFEIPVEVRAGSDTVRLPGCALRAFRLPAGGGARFATDSIVADADIERAVLPAPDSVVAPGQHRLVTLRLTTARLGRDSETGRDVGRIGVRVDESAQSIDRTVGCPDIRSLGPGVQHYGLERVETQPFGLGAIAVAALVITVLTLSGR